MREDALTLADGSRQITDNGLGIRDFYVGLMAVLFGSMQAGQMVRPLGSVVSDRVAERRRRDDHISASSADAAQFAFAPGPV